MCATAHGVFLDEMCAIYVLFIIIMDALYTHAHFDDLDLDTRSQWVGKGKKSSLHALGN